MTFFLMLSVTAMDVTMVTSVCVTTAAADSGRPSDDFPDIGSLMLGSAQKEADDLGFDESKVGAWVDTEGCIITLKDFVRVKVVQNEIAPLEAYCEFLSKRLRLKTILRRRISQQKEDQVSWEYEVDHVGTIQYLDLIEPHIETKKKREQIARARLAYAAKGFRRLFPARGQALTAVQKTRRYRERKRAMQRSGTRS